VEHSLASTKASLTSQIEEKDGEIRSTRQQLDTLAREKADVTSNFEAQIRGLQASLQNTVSSQDGLQQEATKNKEALLTAFIQSWPRSVQRPAIQSARPRNLKRALDWIQTHLGDEFTVLDIARNAGQSVRSLQLSFQQNMGMNPLNYVQRLRLQQIHHDLLHSDAGETISEIAARWGFSHMGYFAARYRAMYGVSPSSTRTSRRDFDAAGHI